MIMYRNIYILSKLFANIETGVFADEMMCNDDKQAVSMCAKATVRKRMRSAALRRRTRSCARTDTEM